MRRHTAEGHGVRKALATGVSVPLAALALVVVTGPAAGAQSVTHTFTAVQCTATVNGQTLQQSQDVTVAITAPDHVAPGQSFTIGFPGGTQLLPTQSNGLSITSYSNLFLTFAVSGTTFNSGSVVNPGTATVVPAGQTAPVSIVEQVTLPGAQEIKIGNPGPFSPGTPGPGNTAQLTTPDVSVGATAGASGPITLNAQSLTTTVVLNNTLTANVVCNIPTTTLVSIPVANTPPPPVVNAGPDVSGNTGTPIALSGSVTDTATTPATAWTIDSASCSFGDASAPATTVSCSSPGTFTATLTANDGFNPPVTDTAQVTVTQVVALSVDAGPDTTGVVSHPVALDGNVSDLDATPTVTWSSDPACTFADATVSATTVTCTTLGAHTVTLTAQDGVNAPASDSATVTVNPDVPPTVSAGPDASGNTGAAIALHGTVTDPDDTPALQWTADSPSCTFSAPTQADTTITCAPQGNYTATLTANDGFNPPVSASAHVAVTDILFPFAWDVNASTHLQKLNMDVTVPQGSFTGVVDLTTGALTGDITLPPAQVTLNLLGIGLVTANMQIVEAQPISGHLDPSTFAVTATAVFDIHVISAYPTATPGLNLVGNSCQTSSPVSVTMSGTANLSGTSTFSGTYTIPPLQNCGLATLALNLVIPGPGNTFTATVSPPPVAPAVTTQPAGQVVAPGQPYTFTAAASGTPDPTVQWQVSTDGGSTFQDVPGATSGTLTGTAALADSGKQFRAVFTNGTGSATSDPATLTVAVPPDPPAIGTASALDDGASVAFTPPANDGGTAVLDYTAQCTSAGGAPGSATGAASPVAVGALTPGATYTCTVTARNAIGSSAPSAASNAVVPTSPPAVTTQPANVTVPAGQPYSFTAAATGTPAPTVQWQVSTDGGNTYQDVAGATGTTLSGTAALSGSGDEFRAVFTNPSGTTTSNPAVLTVTPVAPAVTQQPAAESVTLGQPYTFSAAASGAPAPTVQWQVSTDGGATFQAVPGATSGTLTGTAALADSGKQFRAVFTNVAGSTPSAAAPLTVTVPRTISIGDATVALDHGGKNETATLEVTLSQASTASVTVHYATANGTALAGTDYAAKSGTLTFNAGQTAKAVTVSIKPDPNTDAEETLRVVLSAATGGYTVSPTHGTGSVTVVDPTGTGLVVDVGDATICRAYAGPAQNVTVLVSLSAPATATVTVQLALSPGSAISGVDYKPFAKKTLTFTAGQFQKQIVVSVFPSTTLQPDRTATLTLSNPSAGLAIGRAVGTLTIGDHD